MCFEFYPLVCQIWSMLRQHKRSGNGALCLSPGSWEKYRGGNQLAASSLCVPASLSGRSSSNRTPEKEVSLAMIKNVGHPV